MAPRAHWKGYLKLSLVSCPIVLYPAIDASQRVAFRQINRATGHRLRHQLVDSVTGDVVDSHDKARGYEVGDNQFAAVEDEELEQARDVARTASLRAAPERAQVLAKPEVPSGEERSTKSRQRTPEPAPVIEPPPAPRVENTRTIDIERFIPRAQIDPRYHLTPYYVAPRGIIGEEAFAVIRDAMAGKNVVAFAHIVLSNRERPIILEPLGVGLRAMTLRYAHEIRSEAEYFAEIPQMQLPPQMVSLADHIVDAKLGDFDPALLEDRYRSALMPLLREKKAQVPARAPAKAPSSRTVVNLMDVLKRSLKAEQPPSQRQTRAAAVTTKSASTRRSKPSAGRSRGRAE